MTTIDLEYIAAGGNRHPSAADWNSNTLAFGAGNNIAIYNPQSPDSRGITSLLSGHTDVVNAVKLFQDPDSPHRQILISGSADKTVRVWTKQIDAKFFTEDHCLTSHTASVNTIAVLPKSGIFVTGAADATVRIWRLKTVESRPEVSLIQDISLTSRFFPLAVAITSLADGRLVLAVAGTTASIRIFVQQGETFTLGATLTGHEGWIRSLDFVKESLSSDSDILLASASQDKYIRLWRFHKGSDLPASATASQDPTLGAMGRSLSNKVHYIGEAEGSKHSITFEALLIGHEDWIYTARWFSDDDASKTTTITSTGPRLLTASADNSLAIWEQDTDSGIWACSARLGEISAQKGSTSATGSTGGFWIGLWSSDGKTVVSLGRTGSWRAWNYVSASDRWIQAVGVSGHVKQVKDVAWSRDGSFLLSTSSDQTTRLYSQWIRDGRSTWHEMARPQIHGYDLNCLDSVSSTRFVSGADEKLLRVFDKPKAVAHLLTALSGTPDISQADDETDLPDAANIPVLGLSNKAITTDTAADDDDNRDADGGPDTTSSHATTSSILSNLTQPPFEDHLNRHTLFPEHEKLYGHGHEISAVASSHSGALIATACRASSLEHAVIRLYDAKTWLEVRPALKAHTLTVTSLSWSPDDRFLLSTGRDRQWVVFGRERRGKSGDDEEEEFWGVVAQDPKGHARMILGAAWAPVMSGAGHHVFATAGRDKCVKVWEVCGGKDATNDAEDGAQLDVQCRLIIPTSTPAMALAFTPDNGDDGVLKLAYGTEDGGVVVAAIDANEWKVLASMAVEKRHLPSGAINALKWRPVDGREEDRGRSGKRMLAVASEDCSVRMYGFGGLSGMPNGSS